MREDAVVLKRGFCDGESTWLMGRGWVWFEGRVREGRGAGGEGVGSSRWTIRRGGGGA